MADLDHDRGKQAMPHDRRPRRSGARLLVGGALAMVVLIALAAIYVARHWCWACG